MKASSVRGTFESAGNFQTQRLPLGDTAEVRRELAIEAATERERRILYYQAAIAANGGKIPQDERGRFIVTPDGSIPLVPPKPVKVSLKAALESAISSAVDDAVARAAESAIAKVEGREVQQPPRLRCEGCGKSAAIRWEGLCWNCIQQPAKWAQ